jgi:hypothetical protein
MNTNDKIDRELFIKSLSHLGRISLEKIMNTEKAVIDFINRGSK